MKILHIAEHYAPVGGQEYYIYNVCNELGKRGYENVVVYGVRDNNFWDAEGRKEYYIEGIAGYYCSEENNRHLFSFAEEENPDLIYLHTMENVNLLEKLLNFKPIIKYVHNHNLYCPSGLTSNRFFTCSGKFSSLCFFSCFIGNCKGCRPFSALRQFKIVKENLNIAKKLNAFVVASRYMKQRLIDNGIDKDKIYVIPYFTYPKQIYAQSAESDIPTVLFMGRICKFKGPEYLIKALKYIRQPYKLIIAGDGYHMNYIKKLSKRLRIDKNIEFRGWLNSEELDVCYRQASVVVIPSVWPEPFAVVGIEAMSYAKPVVAFDVGGIKEWLKDGENGFLVEKNDIHMLAERIEILLTDHSLAKRFGARGKQIVERSFTAENHITSLTDLFLKIIKNT